MTSRRQVEKLVFRADEPDRVVASMARLAAAGDGWINVLPSSPDVDDEQPTSLRFMTLFGGGGMGLTMGTWVPPGRDADEGRPRLGITHVVGRRVVRDLAARSVPVPEGWIVEQDHARRGLVVRPTAEEPHGAVLAWAVRAMAELSAPRPIDGWRADVYAPAGG